MQKRNGIKALELGTGGTHGVSLRLANSLQFARIAAAAAEIPLLSTVNGKRYTLAVMTPSAKLRRRLEAPGILVAPGVYDAVGARLVARAGFDCGYVTGAGVSMAGMGMPDIGLASFSEVLNRLSVIAEASDVPLIADGDTGYGGVLNVVRTVKEFERCGAAGIQLEDQVFPKRCGHEVKRRVVPTEEMVAKIAAAQDARASDDFVVIARTDARTAEGIDAAIERAVTYAEAGADVVFVESPESVDEMRRICASVPAPAMANMVEGGRTPLLSRDELQEVGYKLAIYPNSILRLVCRQLERFLAHFPETGETKSLLDEMYSHKELFDLFDFPKWAELEERYVEPAPVQV
jgi:carboxyvinyl-carboxyphosphonate phosphorylmutase